MMRPQMKREVDETVNLHLSKAKDKETEIIRLRKRLDSSYNKAMEILKDDHLVVVYENEKEFIQLLYERLQAIGFKHIIITGDPLELADAISSASGRIAALIVDLIMPKVNGLEVLERYQNLDCKKIAFSFMDVGEMNSTRAREMSDCYIKKNGSIDSAVNSLIERMNSHLIEPETK